MCRCMLKIPSLHSFFISLSITLHTMNKMFCVCYGQKQARYIKIKKNTIKKKHLTLEHDSSEAKHNPKCYCQNEMYVAMSPEIKKPNPEVNILFGQFPYTEAIPPEAVRNIDFTIGTSRSDGLSHSFLFNKYRFSFERNRHKCNTYKTFDR